MKKRLLVLLTTLVLLLSVCTPVYAETGFKSEVRNGVAVLATSISVDNETLLIGWGTCFFVGKSGENPQYLITNHHVIEDYLEYGAGEWITYTEDGEDHRLKAYLQVYFNSNSYVEAYVVDYDEPQDIAVLKTESPVSERIQLPLLSMTNDDVGRSVYAVGYPGIADNMDMHSVTTWGIDDVSVTNGSIGRLVTTSGTGTKWLQTDVAMSNGNSGGPLVDENGAVVGVCRSVFKGEMANEYYAANIESVMSMLKSNGINYEEWKKDGISNILLIGIAAGAAVIIIIVIIILVVKSKKPKQNYNPDLNPNPNPGPYPNPGGNSMVPVVHSMSPQHNGLRVSLNGNQIIIGRDFSSCAIVFREGTPGVSGHHCSVAWDEIQRDFVVTDLKSSYGTFLMNGQRLSVGVPCHVRAGEGFYLGQRDNLIMLELE